MKGEKIELRRGWTTGACAAAAAKAACAGLLTGDFPDPVEITLPGGQRPAFALARWELRDEAAVAAIIKDAGDDPDVTHGALIECTVRPGPPGSGVTFRAGPGVGVVTRAGLPVPPGEPAINPVPRAMIAQSIKEAAGEPGDFEVEISVPGGEVMAKKTMNGRLGIVGGISILGTTGIVIPYSCSAWIHSIHSGVDVALAAGYRHVAASTGSNSERAVQKLYRMDEVQLLDMGDFIGGTLKYIRKHPVGQLTIAGGPAKISKLAQGMLDVHSKRGSADLNELAAIARKCGSSDDIVQRISGANTVAEAFFMAMRKDTGFGNAVAELAWQSAAKVLDDPDIELEIIIFDREGAIAGRAPFAKSGHSSRPLKRR